MTFSKNLFKRSKSGFKAWGRKKQFRKPRPPALNTDRQGQDPRYQRFLYLIGNERIAKECWKLFQKHPRATLPELIAMEYLIRKRRRYIYQVYGISFAIPDFLVFTLAGGIIWMIQGEYWHTLPGRKQQDARIKRMLLGFMTNGVKIYKVIEVWENDLYGDKREETLDMALAGMERRPR